MYDIDRRPLLQYNYWYRLPAEGSGEGAKHPHVFHW